MHIAELLSGAVRPQDVVARHGGEEFVLLMPGTGPLEAAARVDALRRLVADSRVCVDGRDITVTFSAGVAGLTDAQRPADLLAAADGALYVAKQAGRDRVELAGTPALVDHR